MLHQVFGIILLTAALASCGCAPKDVSDGPVELTPQQEQEILQQVESTAQSEESASESP